MHALQPMQAGTCMQCRLHINVQLLAWQLPLPQKCSSEGAAHASTWERAPVVF